MKLVGRRAKIDKVLDWIRFKVDTFPTLDYQPLPWIGVNKAGRSTGTKSRWEQIAPLLKETQAKSLLDIGCNVGWFSISASKMGLSVIGIETMPKNYRTFLFARDKLKLSNVGGVYFHPRHNHGSSNNGKTRVAAAMFFCAVLW